MSSDTVGARLRFEPKAGSATLRKHWRPSQSLAVSRLQRGFRRQWLLALLVMLAVTGAGVAYDMSGGIAPLRAILFWLPFGVAAGLALALVRDLGRNTVTSLSSLGKHRGYNVLGAAPELSAQALRQLPPERRSPLGCLAFQPASPFATAFRDLQSAIGSDSLVSFLSSAHDEGATTAALCTAASAAQQGRSVVVVDCDIRRRTLTRTFETDPAQGVLEACEQPEDWRDFIEEEAETGVHFLPAGRARNPWRSLVASPGFSALIAELRKNYDLVVLDCPPALASPDGAIIAGMAEACVVVAAWDRTPVNAMRRTVSALQQRSRAATSIYVNRVPPGYRFGRLRPD